MNYSNTTPVDLSAFSQWSDAPIASEEEMALWAQAAGYSQPAFDEGIPQDILDDTLAWVQSGTNFAEPFDLQNNFVSIFTFGT